MSTAQRNAAALNIAGCTEARKARSTGATVLILDTRNGGEWAGAEVDGRWISLCNDHSFLLHHQTLADARSWAAAPEDWCEGCQAGAPAEDVEG